MAPEATEGFARAREPREFTFPADHGPHPSFQTEWWYLTGHLREPGRNGTRFGYQLTFFRSSLRPPQPLDGPSEAETPSSSWRSDQLYMAHFALTDVASERFYPFERFSRGAIDLAGARTTPFRVWLDDWFLEAEGGDGLFPLRARAGDGEVGLDLEIDAGRIHLQGDAGLSQKGASPGNASHYYSLTRLPTRGVVRLGDSGTQGIEVEGSTWLDREWSTSALEPGVVGWDWFAIELSDGQDLMVYRLRRDDGSPSPFSSGMLAGPAGEHRTLAAGEVELIPVDSWTSPRTEAVYPSGWRLVVASAGLELEVEPLLAAQEHRGTFAYWEGAATVRGTSQGEPVSGTAYVELTGYEPQ